MTQVAELPIGQVAKASGVSVATIRYYDELGLITPVRRLGGKRRFSPEVIPRVSFIRRAQTAGFSLTDIKTLLDDGQGTRLTVIDRQLADLRKRRDELEVMIATLEEVRRCGCDVVTECERVVAN